MFFPPPGMTGVYYPGDFVLLIILTGSYYLAPSFILRQKKEYIKFFLLFFSSLFSIFWVGLYVANSYEEPSGLLSLLRGFIYPLSILPLLFIAHFIYPFQKTERSQHLSFFLGFLCIFFVGKYILVLAVYILKNIT